MLPDRIGVAIQVPRTKAMLATLTAARTASTRTAAASVRSRKATGAPDNGVERFNDTLKYEHLLHLDTANGQDLAKEAEAYETYSTG